MRYGSTVMPPPTLRHWCRAMIDRAALAKLLLAYPKAILAREFGISLPTLRQIIRGHEPHAHIAEGINHAMARLLQ